MRMLNESGRILGGSGKSTSSRIGGSPVVARNTKVISGPITPMATSKTSTPMIRPKVKLRAFYVRWNWTNTLITAPQKLSISITLWCTLPQGISCPSTCSLNSPLKVKSSLQGLTLHLTSWVGSLTRMKHRLLLMICSNSLWSFTPSTWCGRI
jgi:hypothetical protein